MPNEQREIKMKYLKYILEAIISIILLYGIAFCLGLTIIIITKWVMECP
jgi:hypothetical protein